jgi:tRNA threonylcarbamoyladenosine biosynthesis protein TsaE
MITTFITNSEDGTEAIGLELAQTVKAGDVVALSGELGAGKTAFVRGFAAGLSYNGYVSSPTFTIVNEYLGGRLPLYHLDLYRLNGAEEVESIGWDDYLDSGGVIAAEWSERAGELLPPETIYVDISFGEQREIRIVRISRG